MMRYPLIRDHGETQLYATLAAVPEKHAMRRRIAHWLGGDRREREGY